MRAHMIGTALTMAAVLTLVMGGERAAKAQTPAPSEHGSSIFRTYCASCHGESGRGDGPLSEALTRRPPDLTGIAARHKEVFPAEKVYRIIDGRDLWPVLSGEKNATAPHDVLYFYWGEELHAVRRGKWKLHLPHPYQSLEAAGADGAPGKYIRKEIELSLYDLEADPGETENLAAANPDAVASLMKDVEQAREDLGDSLVKRTGKNVRPVGR